MPRVELPIGPLVVDIPGKLGCRALLQPTILDAVVSVLSRREGRVCKPGQWRVFRDEDDRVVIERWDQ